MTDTTVIFDEMTDAYTITISNAEFSGLPAWDYQPILPKIDTQKAVAATTATTATFTKLYEQIESTSFKLAEWQKKAIVVISKGETASYNWNAIPSTPADPRDVTREELLAAFRAVVGRLGEDFSATSHSTNIAINGSRCIQGEVMLELGFGTDRALPCSADGVATLLGLQEDTEAYSLLETAEMSNDMGATWGFILTRAEHVLAA